MITNTQSGASTSRPGVAAPGSKSGASEASGQQQSTGPTSTESLRESILASLTGHELTAAPAAKADKTESSAAKAKGAADASLEDQPGDTSLTEQAKGDGEGDGGEAEADQTPEGADTDAAEADDDEPIDEKGWTKSAIDTVTGLRQAKRELRKEAESLKQKVTELETKLQQQPEAGKGPALPATTQHPDPIVREAVQHESEAMQNINIAQTLLDKLEDEGAEVVLELFQRAKLNAPGSDERSLKRGLGRMLEGYRTELAKAEARKTTALTTFQQKLEGERKSTTEKAAKSYPWLNDPKSAEFKQAQEMRKRFPGIANLPDGDLIVARYVAGQMAEEKGRAVTPVPAPKPKPTKLPGTSARQPQQPNGNTSTADLLKKYQETGDQKDKEAWAKAALGSAVTG